MKQKQVLLESLTKEQQKIRREMDVVFRLHMAAKISPDGFALRNTPLEERLKQVEDQMPQLQGELDYLKIQYLSRDQIPAEARDIYTRWPDLERDEKRTIVEHTLERIVVGKDDINIELSYIPPSSKIMINEQRSPTPALPFCHLTLKAQKPKPAAYPNALNTLGDQLRARRLDLGLCQKELAEMLGVTGDTICLGE